MRQILPFNIIAFSKVLSANGLAVEAVLRETLCNGWAGGEEAKADSRQQLVAAMGHALFAGGKRFRPFLLKSCAEMCTGSPNAGEAGGDPLLAGAAVECLHTYSLVHDDLPAMDDDDVRRGQPSVHKAFDEATAILAGDALMTLAFEILARPGVHPDPAVRLEMIG
ncbi:MAG: polyprenyl synthetase family protein, partial [Alphaproteobacteria bacterium]